MRNSPPVDSAADVRNRYLDLMKKCLSHSLWFEQEFELFGDKQRDPISRWVEKFTVTPEQRQRRMAKSMELKSQGKVWPQFAHTMIGHQRLENIQQCVSRVIEEQIPGDLIETGVWRGGACIFMRAILASYGIADRTVWVADSFEGLPAPNADRAPADAGNTLFKHSELAVSLEQVKANFEKYGLLDDQVKFLKGWFKDTLPTAPVEQLAVARLDGDLYESTMDALVSLYPKLSVGGYLILDDYNYVPNCKKAVDDYRAQNNISEPIQSVDWSAAFWRRER